jgi:hypothetical protein
MPVGASIDAVYQKSGLPDVKTMPASTFLLTRKFDAYMEQSSGQN